MREENIERLRSYRDTPVSDLYYLVYEPLFRDLEECVAKYAKGKVLDIGCGNKPYESMFSGKISSYTGCDVVQSSENKVDVICEATSIPLGNENFDTIFSTQTIEHVADHQALVNEAFRLLKPGGYFILSGPMYWPLHEEPHDYFRFTKHGFRHILEKAGFSVEEIRSNGGKWLLLGQVILHTMPARLTRWKWMRRLHNRFFLRLNRKHPDESNTMNYVIVSKKPA
jgi:SAM-dependent methyltransferase